MTYLPKPQQTPWQQSTEIDLSRCAVLVIDVLGGSAGPTPGLETMAENAVSIVKAARKANLPVLFTNDAHIEGVDRELNFGKSMAFATLMPHNLWQISKCRKATTLFPSAVITVSFKQTLI